MVLGSWTPGPFLFGLSLFNGLCVGLETDDFYGFIQDDETDELTPMDTRTAWVLSLGPLRLVIAKIR